MFAYAKAYGKLDDEGDGRVNRLLTIWIYEQSKRKRRATNELG